jgi:glycosyltransferase involved in cell wall biosynthesis
MAQGVAATGYLTSDISVIPNSADLDEFDVARPAGQSWREQLKVRDDQILVGYVGTLGRVNNVTQLVEIAGELADDARFRFVIVGDGIERELVTRLARERGVLGRSLHLLDAAPKSAMPGILAALDVATSFVLPIREMEMNSANKFFDALAAGRCVAINHGGWQADLLETFNAGIQMPYDSAPAAAALRALADQPGLIQRKGHNARKLAADQFSRDALANQLEQVLVNVVQATALHSDEPG